MDSKATPSGFFLSQPAYTADLLEKWSMSERRPIGSLDDIEADNDSDEEELDDEGSPTLQSVRKAQRIAGGLNWLATRTRPEIAFYVSQISSAATRVPARAIALGKRCLRYLAGTRTHGVSLFPSGTP